MGINKSKPENNNQQDINISQNYQQTQSSIPNKKKKLFSQSSSKNFVDEIWNDDQPIPENMKVKEGKQFKEEPAKIEMEIKAQRTMIKLKEQTILPAMCSIKTSGGSRSSVDLICVIDVSGSMRGQKIQLVRQTLSYVLQSLSDNDRLSIIVFQSHASRICGLQRVTKQNMVSFNAHIKNLSAGGGTNINSGLILALKTIRQRKTQNKVTSIFLLSDGQDSGADQQFRHELIKPQNKSDLGTFTLHSFGFGNDHDEDLMTKLCSAKQGTFYYIDKLQTLDEAFANALGGIISVVADDILIKLKNVSKNLVQGIKIKRTFGQMWQKINDKEYKIKILQLMSGVSKDYVFELSIPFIDSQVGDLDRNCDVLEASLKATSLKGQQLKCQSSLKMTLLNNNEEIPQINENQQVVENYLRIKASEAIELNMKRAQERKYQQAQKDLDRVINDIQGNKRARKDKMINIINDLQMVKEQCQQERFANQGRKNMKRAMVQHMKQESYAYSNAVQQCMVQQRRAKKSKF